MISANLIYISDPSAYTNDDAIFHAINYITRHNDENIFYYGNWPPTPDSAIELFEHLRSHLSLTKQYECRQQLQHFWITFDSSSAPDFINIFSNDIALIFAPLFPICLATHNKIYHPHTHFVVSTTSILPSQKPLIGKVWDNYLAQVCELAQTRYDIHLTVKPKTNTVIQK